METLEKDFRLDNSIGHIVNIVANRMKQELETTFEKSGYDISALQWMLLSIIHENNGISQNELSKKSKKDKTNIARVIDKLEKKELIKRIRDDNDKRAFRLYATNKGKELRGELSLLASGVVDKSTNGITEEEHQICLDTLKKIYTNLE